MRKYFILFALSVFFAGITMYLVGTLNPFDETQVAQLVKSENIKVKEEFDQVITDLMDKGLISEFLNVRNVALLASTALLSILSGFMLIHLILDRLIVKKFYEQPSIFVALRRGVFVCLGVLSIFVYKIFAAEWYLTLLTLGLLLIVELVISRITAKILTDEELQLLITNADKATSSAVEASDDVKLKQKFKIQIPHPRTWAAKFRENVMRQVAESQESSEIQSADDISESDEPEAMEIDTEEYTRRVLAVHEESDEEDLN